MQVTPTEKYNIKSELKQECYELITFFTEYYNCTLQLSEMPLSAYT